MKRREPGTWTPQAEYRFRKVESKRYRTHRPALIEQSLVDILVSHHPSYDGGVRQIDLRHSVEHVLETISVREERVVRLYLGIGEEALSFEGVGKMIGCSFERARQIYRQALRRLRHPARSKHLRDFLVNV